MDCMIASGMAGAMEKVFSGMNQACMEYLETITIGRMEEWLILRGKR